LLVTFPNKRSFGRDLSTRASRLLHKCRENDTIYVLSSKAISAAWLLLGINDSGISFAV